MQKNMKGVKFSKRLYTIKHYILFGYLTKNKFNVNVINDGFNKLIYIILYIPGIMKSRRF